MLIQRLKVAGLLSSRRPLRNVGASVRARLRERSGESGEDFQFLLKRYAAERFLFRLGESPHRKSYSETWTDIAVPAVVMEDLRGVLCGYHLAHIRPNEQHDGFFLSHCIAAVGPRDQHHIAANGITRFGLTGDTIRNGTFAIPPLAEQRRIAAFKIDDLIANIRKSIDRFNELRTALISAAVTGKIDVREPPA